MRIGSIHFCGINILRNTDMLKLFVSYSLALFDIPAGYQKEAIIVTLCDTLSLSKPLNLFSGTGSTPTSGLKAVPKPFLTSACLQI